MAVYEGRFRYRVDVALYLAVVLSVDAGSPPFLSVRLPVRLLVVPVLYPLELAVVRAPLARLREPAYENQESG